MRFTSQVLHSITYFFETSNDAKRLWDAVALQRRYDSRAEVSGPGDTRHQRSVSAARGRKNATLVGVTSDA